MIKITFILCQIFLSLLFSQDYYGVMKNIGKISENGADIIIYYDNKGVRAYMHNYDNRYDNTSFYLFGRGDKNDKSLQLRSLIVSEGSYWDGGVYILVFLDDRNRILIYGNRQLIIIHHESCGSMRKTIFVKWEKRVHADHVRRFTMI